MTEQQYLAQQDALIDAHMAEAESKGAEFYNLGWASGEDFTHSKTDKGRLFTQLNSDGSFSHEWEV